MQSILRKCEDISDPLPALLFEYRAAIASTPPTIIDNGWIALGPDGIVIHNDIKSNIDFQRLIRVARSTYISLVFPHLVIYIYPKSPAAFTGFEAWFKAASVIVPTDRIVDGHEIDKAWIDVMHNFERADTPGMQEGVCQAGNR
jgi:hypothetical protein